MTARRFHLAATYAWAGLVIPTVIWWRDSVAWISYMSVYACLMGHWSSYQAARAEDASNGG